MIATDKLFLMGTRRRTAYHQHRSHDDDMVKLAAAYARSLFNEQPARSPFHFEDAPQELVDFLTGPQDDDRVLAGQLGIGVTLKHLQLDRSLAEGVCMTDDELAECAEWVEAMFSLESLRRKLPNHLLNIQWPARPLGQSISYRFGPAPPLAVIRALPVEDRKILLGLLQNLPNRK